eukprot:10383017-Lingulodinium_polyedra.AAC.1
MHIGRSVRPFRCRWGSARSLARRHIVRASASTGNSSFTLHALSGACLHRTPATVAPLPGQATPPLPPPLHFSCST